MDIAFQMPFNVKTIQDLYTYKQTQDFEIYRPVQAWHWMIQSRRVPDQMDWVRPEVSDAWRRCLDDYQLPLGNYAQWEQLPFSRLSKPVVNSSTELLINRLDLLNQQFHIFLKGAGVVLVLAGVDGSLLKVLGENPLPSKIIRSLYEKNSLWGEADIGNNGIGTAIQLNRPVAFQGMEHFLSLLHPFTTIGYPITGNDGNVQAVLGLISDRQESMNSLFAFLHLLCVLINTNLPLTQSTQAQSRVLEKIPFKLAQKPPQQHESAISPQLETMIDKAVKLQNHKVPILITGESGVGKDHFVKLIKNAGPRRNQPLIAINCASIPRDLIESELFGYETGSFTGARNGGKPGKFLLADKGILFLDEIGDMSLDLQSTLLRVLETSEFTPIGASRALSVDVQIIAATNVPLQEAVEAGRFRRDLYYRLNGAQLYLPPLREREDRHSIIHHILQRELAKLPNPESIQVCPEVITLIENHPWPGNIRQLINVIRATIYTAGEGLVTQRDLPLDFIQELENNPTSTTAQQEQPTEMFCIPQAKNMSLEDWEIHGIKSSLQACCGNISLAAKQLGITRTTLYKKMDRFGLERIANFNK